MSNPPPRRSSRYESWSRRQWRTRLQAGTGSRSPRQAVNNKVTPISSRRRRREGPVNLPTTQRRRVRREPMLGSSVPFPSRRGTSSYLHRGVPGQIPLPPPTPRPGRPGSQSGRSGSGTTRKTGGQAQNRTGSAVGTPRRRRRRRLPVPAPLLPMLYGARLAIAGIGLSAVAGTLMALWTPVPSEGSVERQESLEMGTAESLQRPLGRELTDLTGQLQELVAEYPDLTPGLMVVDVTTGDYAQMGQDRPFSAASTIKIPILVAFLQAVDAGQVRLDEPLRLEESHIAGGAGRLQDEVPGLELSALEVATLMMVESDNTATNLIIDRLGGMAALNGRFRQWGMQETLLEDWLPDLQGTNQTTPRELAGLLSQIERGELLSMASRDRMLRIMMLTENDGLLPQGVGRGGVIAHKTGNLRFMLADAGLVDVVNGQRYVLVALVERPEYEEDAASFIRELSARVYGYFGQSD